MKCLVVGLLKPGQLCWLTNVKTPKDVGKVVEVLGYLGNHHTLGDLYRIKCRDPLVTETVYVDNGVFTGEAEKLNYEANALRIQLIPINDPGLNVDDINEQKQDFEYVHRRP